MHGQVGSVPKGNLTPSVAEVQRGGMARMGDEKNAVAATDLPLDQMLSHSEQALGRLTLELHEQLNRIEWGETNPPTGFPEDAQAPTPLIDMYDGPGAVSAAQRIIHHRLRALQEVVVRLVRLADRTGRI